MSNVLLIFLGIYLTGCYAYGMYLMVRLLRTPKTIRPTSRLETTELVSAARAELQQEASSEQEHRIAA